MKWAYDDILYYKQCQSSYEQHAYEQPVPGVQAIAMDSTTYFLSKYITTFKNSSTIIAVVEWTKSKSKPEAKDVLPNKPHAGRRKGGKISFFCPWWSWPFSLTFKLARARDQTRLPCEFGANLLSSSQDISYTNKRVTNSAKNRTLRSSLCAVKTTSQSDSSIR